jgi:hypothetical protein
VQVVKDKLVSTHFGAYGRTVQEKTLTTNAGMELADYDT